MKCSLAKTFLLIGISLIALTPIAAGQTQLPAGSLDNSFGREGKVALRPGYESKLSSIALQEDGKIVVAGAIYPITYKVFFSVARFNSDGTPDEGFGSNGMVITRFESNTLSVSAIAIQPDGKIVVTSELTAFQPNGSYLQDFVVLRFNSDGSPDSGFGKNGEVTTDFSGVKDSSKALALQPDGKIVVGGSTSATRPDLELARYNPDGTLDQTFNSTGLVITPNSNDSDSFNALALQSDGRIVVAGSRSNGKDVDGLLIRYNSDGSIDQSFGVDGRVVADFGANDYIRSLQIQSDGKILIVGTQRIYFFSDGADLFLARYNQDGSPDQHFGSNGKIIASFGKYAEAYSAVLQSDGKILIAGTSGPGNPIFVYSLPDFLAVRYNADGTLDKDFGDGGKVLTDFGRLDRARAVAIDAKGNIILAGYTGDYTWDGFDQSDFALARYIGIAPKPLPDFALSTTSTMVNASRGSKVRLPINIDRLNGFAGSITIQAPDTGNLKIVIPEPSLIATGTSVNFTLKIKKGTPTGNHQLIFTGKDDSGHEHSATITLVIQ